MRWGLGVITMSEQEQPVQNTRLRLNTAESAQHSPGQTLPIKNVDYTHELARGNHDSWHQLLIIGNGFDLACGLKSKFTDFKAARKDCFTRGDMRFKKTVWDVMLDQPGKGGWSDIETAIAEWIVPGKNHFSRLSKVTTLLHNYQMYGSYQSSMPGSERKVASFILKNFERKGSQWSDGQLSAIAGEQLHILENDFSKYLLHEVNITSDYQAKACELLDDLLVDELPVGELVYAGESVLSFNYTRPIEFPTFPYVNIHGRLADEIVFGIDGKDRMELRDVVPFTKTYRIMALNQPDMGRLVRLPNSGNGVTNLIKFYGHSLAPADFSYFESIFDAVDLYGGRTRLVFYYRPFDGWSSEDVQHDTMDRVIKLLAAYGNTLDNKDHGKNLIHKLLLEGRLSVKLLPSYVASSGATHGDANDA